MKTFFLLLLIINILYSKEFVNDLQYESSPYLKQHQYNPIDWLPWGDKAFEKAKKENKAIFLSIGYSTCHWCHNMAKESFEDIDIAKLLNENFVSIKVDREELPHIDSLYQEIHYKAKNKRAGWPLNIFMTHEKEVFYSAGYIPKTQKGRHEGLETLLPKFAALQNNEIVYSLDDTDSSETNDLNITELFLKEQLLEEYDAVHSGFGKVKKFPESAKLQLMMQLSQLNSDKLLNEKSLEMLDKMALRGLYDHVDGGFFRYAVDPAWEIPHFEKMLFNQAELIPLYVKAYLQTKKELYKSVVTETISMLDKRFMKNDLYFSASDADSNHIEGGFFIYSPEEIEKALEKLPNSEELEEALEFSIYGNFNKQVHLNFYTENRPSGFDEFRDELKKLQARKEFPFIDKKINTAWNAMMIEALFYASAIDAKYAQKAQKHLDALQGFMFDRGELYHQSLLENKPKQLALLEDYAFFIAALLTGYQVDFQKEKLDFSYYLLQKSKNYFYKNGKWYLSNDALDIKADLFDKYYTSPQAKMLQNILKFAAIKSDYSYYELASKTLERILPRVKNEFPHTPASATAYLMQKNGIVTIKSSKENLLKYKSQIEKINYPYIVLKEEETDKYLACTMQKCFAIEEKFENIVRLIEGASWR